jgi:hypothetical protein
MNQTTQASNKALVLEAFETLFNKRGYAAARTKATKIIQLQRKEERTMNTYTAVTVPTLFVEANGIRFAYRRFGKEGGIPLVFNQHFTGNLDNWDPAVIDGLAQEREVILFNNAE